MVPRHDLTDKRRPQAGVHSGQRPVGPPTQRAVNTRTTAQVLSSYLNGHAGEVLRSLRLYDENAGSAETAAEAAEAVRLLRRSARRLACTLQTFRPVLETAWADRLTAELRWLSGVLAKEYQYAARLNLLLAALHRLSTPAVGPGTGEGEEEPRTGRPGAGAAKAGALLDRQLSLARTRAHSAALRALGSGRFHAVADEIAVLASEVPVDERAAEGPAHLTLRPLAELTHRRLVDAVEALPYGPEALAHTLTLSEGRHDAAWNQVRHFARQTRYALEVLDGALDRALEGAADDEGAGSPEVPEARAVHATGTASSLHGALTLIGHQLNRHRDAAEAAASAASAGGTPRITPATAYALGVLHADQRHEVEAARLAFCRIWPPRGELQEGPAHASPS